MTQRCCPSCGQVMPASGVEPLTPRQKDALDAVIDWIGRCGFPPTLTEIAIATGRTSRGGVSEILAQIEEKGWIRRTGGHRGIVVLRRPTQADVRRITSGPAGRPMRSTDAPPSGTRRDCLQCGCPFISVGPGNRVCYSCKDQESWSSGNDLSVVA